MTGIVWGGANEVKESRMGINIYYKAITNI